MRFLATRELGRLSRWLRLMGFDTAYAAAGTTRAGVILQALQEERVLLTRDKRFFPYRGMRTIRVASEKVDEQLAQVLRDSRARADAKTFYTRCLKCNTPLEEIEKEGIKQRVPPHVFKTVDEFVRCAVCDQIFWAGTHLKLAEDFLKTVNL